MFKRMIKQEAASQPSLSTLLQGQALMSDRIAIILASWFGSGYIRPASGSWGSLAALPFAYWIVDFYGDSGLFIASLLALLVGVWASDRYNKLTNTADSGRIVIDEVAGMWLTLAVIFIPVHALAPADGAAAIGTNYMTVDPMIYLLGFVLFRVFDILKPFPANRIDRFMKGGWGVMMDDIFAGIYAGLAAILLAKDWGYATFLS